MTKKWSSTRSGDGKTKRQASKAARKEREPSIADQMVDAELSRSMGGAVPDWLADMLPD